MKKLSRKSKINNGFITLVKRNEITLEHLWDLHTKILDILKKDKNSSSDQLDTLLIIFITALKRSGHQKEVIKKDVTSFIDHMYDHME